MLDINKLYYEDCLEGMKKIDDKSIDFILCDLPYGTTSCKWDVIIPFDKLWEQYNRIIKNKANIALFGSGIFAYKLALSNEIKFRYEMIWKKSKCGSPLTAKYMPLKKHENILIFGDGASFYEPQMSIGKPYSRKFTLNKSNNMKFGIKGVETNNEGTRHPTTILDFKQKWRRQDQMHPTQKPVDLLEFLINSFCPSNGLILDNCAGSGSTLVAAKNLNRRFIGFENNLDYYKIACERIGQSI